MRRKIIVLIFCIFGINIQGQNAIFTYHSGVSEDWFSKSVKLTLNSDNSFAYKFVNNHGDYIETSISFGNWKRKGGRIYLNVADSLKPKISFESKFLKKDTITVFLKRANEKAYFEEQYSFYDSGRPEFKAWREFLFYDGESNAIKIYYNNHVEKLEVPKNKEVEKIEMRFRGNYLKISVLNNVGQIFIDNLSRYLITDFKKYSFLFNKDKVILECPYGTYILKKQK